MSKRNAFITIISVSLFFNVSSFLSAKDHAASVPKGMMGISYCAWLSIHYDNAEQHLNEIKQLGFQIVSFCPSYYYVGLDHIDFSNSPGWDVYSKAVETALRKGLVVVLKPHLDPLMYLHGYEDSASDNHSWRVYAPWRGFFDVDPMCDDYRNRLIGRTLEMLHEVFARLLKDETLKGRSIPSVRLELGTELMNSIVYSSDQWVLLLAEARKDIERLNLEGRVILSHNFSSNLEIPEDVVLRMSPKGRISLAAYIRGLDAIALSQYMDLTVAIPENERGKRLPTPDEIARALVLHEENFREKILKQYLGLKTEEIPRLHLGEFGIGLGGLKHPEVWRSAKTPEQEKIAAIPESEKQQREKELDHEIALGMQGLGRYLDLSRGRWGEGAVLWLGGPHYDIFGWVDPAFPIPEAIDAVKDYLKTRKPAVSIQNVMGNSREVK